MITPDVAPRREFNDPDAALAHAAAIYDAGVTHLRQQLQAFLDGNQPGERVRATYPYVRIRVDTVMRADSRLAYGFVAGPGRYETTLTRPDLFGPYYREQFRLLLRNHAVALEVGASDEPIPVHFSLAEDDHLEGTLTPQRRQLMRDLFDLPDLAAMDDGIANGSFEPGPREAHPLSLFTAPRVDYSLHRMRHYTGTRPEHFQNFVLFTNYQFYIDEFIKLGRETMSAAGCAYAAFVEPGNVITRPGGATEGIAPPRIP
jgi:AMP nucleosidase